MKKLWFCIFCILLTAVVGMVLRPRFPKEPGAGQPAELDPIAERIAAMTPEEKAGQLMLVGMDGVSPSTSFQQEMKDHPYGGVILFDRNMESSDQVKELNRRLQALAGKMPLFIGLDEEGGQVACRPHLPRLPSGLPGNRKKPGNGRQKPVKP